MYNAILQFTNINICIISNNMYILYHRYDYSGHELYDTNPFYGHNEYPDSSVLPEFKTIMSQYHSNIQSLAQRITPLIFKSLGINDNDNPAYTTGNFDQQFNALRLIHYPSVSGKQPTITLQDGTLDTIYGNGGHTDSGLLTILSTDKNNGLQILNKNNVWIDIPHRDNAFIVNLGDMLNVWTNGVYQSTMHRVIRKPGSNTRYSVPFFYNPQYDAIVKPLSVCVSVDNPAIYKPVTVGQHIINEFNKGLLRVNAELKQRTKRDNIIAHEYKQDEIVNNNNMTAASKYDILLNNDSCGESYNNTHMNTSSCGESYKQQRNNASCGEAYNQQLNNTSCGESYNQQCSNTTCGESYKQQLSSCGEAYQQQLHNATTSRGEAYNQLDNNSSSCGEAYKQHQITSTTSCGEAYGQQLNNSSCGESYKQQLTNNNQHSCGEAYSNY